MFLRYLRYKYIAPAYITLSLAFHCGCHGQCIANAKAMQARAWQEQTAVLGNTPLILITKATRKHVLSLARQLQLRYPVDMESINNIELLSVGAKVPKGRFEQIYSRHAKVINFSCGDKIASVCTKEHCPGPYRVILDTDTMPEIVAFTRTNHMLNFNNCEPMIIYEPLVYESPDFLTCTNAGLISNNIVRAFADFRNLGSPGCVYRLITTSLADTNTFSAALTTHYRQGVKMFREKEYEKAVNCFKRKGIGLTPAGDDFLVGFIIGIAWLSRVQRNELSKILKVIFVVSLGNDPLVNTFLTQAYSLQLDEDWAMFLSSLATKDDDFLWWMIKIIGHGSSSGSDELSGFYLACKLYCNDIGLDY